MKMPLRPALVLILAIPRTADAQPPNNKLERPAGGDPQSAIEPRSGPVRWIEFSSSSSAIGRSPRLFTRGPVSLPDWKVCVIRP